MIKKNVTKNYAFVVTGVLLVLVVSIAQGFEKSAAEAFEHVINDLTAGLMVHLYIAGVVLLAIGVANFRK